jgi:hypothetical protein
METSAGPNDPGIPLMVKREYIYILKRQWCMNSCGDNVWIMTRSQYRRDNAKYSSY